jgi:Zn-dependent peptidase ImmA (M78 family)
MKEKEYLTELINSLALKNILVFEFIETWNKKDKANIDGFFLQPNVIVLKRQQISFKREIFTLAHELGHYLLNEEEIEQTDYSNLINQNLSKIENWCNDFAYYFLIGQYDKEIDKITIASENNDYCDNLITTISKNTNISKIALYTRLLKLNKISRNDYSLIFNSIQKSIEDKAEEDKKKRELDKLNGLNKGGGAVPVPIKSPLLISTIQTAFYEGVINEYEFCKRLNIKPEKISYYI